MKTLYAAVFSAFLASSASSVMAADAEVEAIVSSNCSTCHGAKGYSTSPIFPSLAGQNQEYLVKQLQDFRSKKRVSDTMGPQAANLTDQNIAGLAAFFAGQPAKVQRVSDTDLVAVGRYIYTKGNTWSGVPACSSCHGDNAYGTATLPRLAGQNTRYLLSQLKDFNLRVRTNDNEAMHLVASRLTEMETQAVASYLGQLP